MKSGSCISNEISMEVVNLTKRARCQFIVGISFSSYPLCGRRRGVWSKNKIISKYGRKRDGRRGVGVKGGSGER